MIFESVADSINDMNQDVFIEEPVLNAIKDVFQRAQLNASEGLYKVLHYVKGKHGFSHSVLFFEGSLYPNEVRLIRHIAQTGIFEISIDEVPDGYRSE